MVSNAFASFVEGFAGTLAVNINERKKEARDYFNKQVEYARTTGMENRKKVKSTVDQNTSIASQLQAVGVPKEVIMAQISMDPNSLGDMANQTEKLRASAGREFSAEEWKAIYEVAEDYKAPDEDIATFISRTYDPISNAANSPGFKEDPKGSLISSMMGFSSMDEARDRLKTTDIGGGLTADQLMRYGDSAPERTGPRATVTTNYGAVKKVTDSGGGLSPTEANYVQGQLGDVGDDMLTKFEKDFFGETGVPVREGTNANQILDAMVGRLSRQGVGNINAATVTPLVKDWLTGKGYSFTEGEAPSETPEGVTETTTAPEPTTPTPAPTEAAVDDPMSAPIDIEKEPHLQVIPEIIIRGKMRSLRFTSDNGDGTSLWIDQDGEEIKLKNAGLRARSQ